MKNRGSQRIRTLVGSFEIRTYKAILTHSPRIIVVSSVLTKQNATKAKGHGNCKHIGHFSQLNFSTHIDLFPSSDQDLLSITSTLTKGLITIHCTLQVIWVRLLLLFPFPNPLQKRHRPSSIATKHQPFYFLPPFRLSLLLLGVGLNKQEQEQQASSKSSNSK